MRRRSSALLIVAAVLAGTVTAAGKATAAQPPIMLGIHTAGESLTITAAINAWVGKTAAFVDTQQGWHPDTEGRSTTADDPVFAKLDAIWSAGSVPEMAWYPSVSSPTSDLLIAAGRYDVYLTTFIQRLKPWLAGPDGTFGTADDRRLLLRFAPEANGDWQHYSPIDESNPPAKPAIEQQNARDYVAMWQHVHTIFTTNGLDSSHVAWVSSVADTDSYSNGVAITEQIYPGDAYVDWLGIDGYNFGGRLSNSQWRSPSEVFDPMLTRLRALSTRPAGASEFASTAIQNDGTVSVAAKAQWLTDFGTWAASAGIRMAMYWNDDNDSPDNEMFDGPYGDSTVSFGGTTYTTYDEYRTLTSAPAYVGADSSNPRLVSDSVFLGT